MFFVLHSDACGSSIPHHGHSHGGGGHGHGHSHGGDDHEHSHGNNHGHSHGNNHGHSHDDSHNHTDTVINADIVVGEDQEQAVKAKKRKQNINVRAAMIHVIGDFVQSVGVLCAAILIHFKV